MLLLTAAAAAAALSTRQAARPVSDASSFVSPGQTHPLHPATLTRLQWVDRRRAAWCRSSRGGRRRRQWPRSARLTKDARQSPHRCRLPRPPPCRTRSMHARTATRQRRGRPRGRRAPASRHRARYDWARLGSRARLRCMCNAVCADGLQDGVVMRVKRPNMAALRTREAASAALHVDATYDETTI